MLYLETFSCILADPPWPETGGGRIKRGADKHYNVMKPYAILETMLCAPCWRPASNSHLWLWATNNHLLDAFWLMSALGFRYVTNVAWGKAEQVNEAWQQQRQGLGQYIGGQHELLLFGVRGRLSAAWKKTRGLSRPGTLLLAARREHSRKPEEAYDVIERVSPPPRLEMFARGDAHADWWIWGRDANT